MKISSPSPQRRVSWWTLIWLLISLLGLYFKCRKEDEENMRRWQERQQAQQEAEEQISRQADETRRTVKAWVRQMPKERHDRP